jgi:hypothetical protein
VVRAASGGAGVAAGSQQQPPAGIVGQQHPARLIDAVRPEVVPAVADPPSPINNVPKVVIRTIPAGRRKERDLAMTSPIPGDHGKALVQTDPALERQTLLLSILFDFLFASKTKKPSRRMTAILHAIPQAGNQDLSPSVGVPNPVDHPGSRNPQNRSHASYPENR